MISFITNGALTAWNYAQHETEYTSARIVALGALSALAALTVYQCHFKAKPLSTYQISVNLMCAAQKHNKLDYDKQLKSIFKSLSIDSKESQKEIVEKLKGNRSFNSWMCGRILLSSLRIGDKATAAKMIPIIEELLKEVGDNLPAHVWGLGYLAIYYAATQSDQFSRIKDLLLERTRDLGRDPKEKTEDNFHWVIVMNLQSLALAGNEEAYKDQLQQLMDFAGTKSVGEALKQIPTKDMRAWANQLTLSAAQKMRDSSLIKELQGTLCDALKTSPENDKMLTVTLSSFSDFAFKN